MADPHPKQSAALASRDPVRPMDHFLESNGLGSYACTTLCGVCLWPSQGLVVVSTSPPGRRFVLLHGFDVRVTTPEETLSLSTRQVRPGTLEPDSRSRLLGVEPLPWPVWRFDLGEGSQLDFECLVRHGSHQFVFSWQLTASPSPVTLRVRPLLSGRPIDSTRQEDPRLLLRPRQPHSRQFVWPLRSGSPDLTLLCDGAYHHDPSWLQGLFYEDFPSEDLAAPGEFVWRLQPRERAHLIASAEKDLFEDPHTRDFVALLADKTRKAELTRRRLFRSDLDRAVDQYVVSGKEGHSILSGYPEGVESGTETMISLRGLSLSPGRLEVVSHILATWSGRFAGGLLPHTFSEQRGTPAFDSPEPSLWFVIAVYEYIRASYRHGRIISPEERTALESDVHGILATLTAGLHRQMFMADDGLLSEIAVGKSHLPAGTVVKRAHIQALWIASLWIGNRLQSSWSDPYLQARTEFERTFWNTRKGYLFHAIISPPGRPRERPCLLDPNQILAVGGLPVVCLGEARASLLVQAMERHFADLGVPQSAPLTPWQFGPFIEAWFRVHHRQSGAPELALRRFIAPWEQHLRSGIRTAGPHALTLPSDLSPAAPRPQVPFRAVETMELLRVLHLPELIREGNPFDDSFQDPLFD